MCFSKEVPEEAFAATVLLKRFKDGVAFPEEVFEGKHIAIVKDDVRYYVEVLLFYQMNRAIDVFLRIDGVSRYVLTVPASSTSSDFDYRTLHFFEGFSHNGDGICFGGMYVATLDNYYQLDEEENYTTDALHEQAGTVCVEIRQHWPYKEYEEMRGRLFDEDGMSSREPPDSALIMPHPEAYPISLCTAMDDVSELLEDPHLEEKAEKMADYVHRKFPKITADFTFELRTRAEYNAMVAAADATIADSVSAKDATALLAQPSFDLPFRFGVQPDTGVGEQFKFVGVPGESGNSKLAYRERHRAGQKGAGQRH